jgi:capsular polysaccharide biosynthesis protein
VPVAEAGVERRAVSGGYSPRPLIYAAVAAGAGLLLGGAVALILEGRASGWRGVRDAELTLRAPVLGAIPDYSSKRSGG